FRVQAGTAMAHFLAGRHDTAVSWAEKARRDVPFFLIAVATVAASHALAGRPDQAAQAIGEMRELDPTLRVSNIPNWLAVPRPEDLAIFANGLRKAGLPE